MQDLDSGRGRATPLDQLLAIGEGAPAGITLFEVTIDDARDTIMRGEAKAAGDMLDFIEAIEETGLYRDVELMSAGSGADGAGDKTGFEMRAIP